MKQHNGYTILLLLLVSIPFGIISAQYSASSPHLAALLGVSQDENSWLNIVYMGGLLTTLPLACWLVYRFGAHRTVLSGAVIGLFSSLIHAFSLSFTLHLLAWIGLAMASSLTIVGAQVYLLRHLGRRQMLYTEGGILLLTALLPTRVFPWLIALLAENDLLPLVSIVQAVCYLLFIGGYWLSPLTESTATGYQINLLQVVLVTLFFGGLTFILLRGNTYNWLDHPWVISALLLTGTAFLLLALVIRQRWGAGSYLDLEVLQPLQYKVSMYNAALAGFIATGSAMLLSGYLLNVLKYSLSESRWIQLPSFAAMLLGLLISLWFSNHKKLKTDMVLPLGVILILIANILLTNADSSSGYSDLWLALFMLGLGVGILNVAVTISILFSLSPSYIPQGVSYFYLFRTLGGVLSTALFSRLTSSGTAEVTTILAENLQSGSDLFLRQQQMTAALLQQTTGEASMAQVAALMAGKLTQQTAAVVGINNFQWLVVGLMGLGMVLVIGKVRLAKQASKT